MRSVEGKQDIRVISQSLKSTSQVPLNYSDPAGETAAIAVIRLPSILANSSAYRGPILINPGGPGE